MRLPTRIAGAGSFVGCLAVCGAAPAAGPDVRWLYPAGGCRGTTVEVTAGGKFEAWPVQAWADRPGLTFSPLEEKGKLSVTIDEGAAPGRYWVRLFDADGAGAPQAFIVGTLGELVDAEPNNAPGQAQAAGSSTVIVNGRLGGNGDIDSFSLPLARGRRWSLRWRPTRRSVRRWTRSCTSPRR